ncbi:hypothetical protein B0I72DRAFT_149702 [Yarrowia lipolytica]|uniref:Uncharacterized protein n=1 Tax=Yarrowia lipolytica TaxID=4952 RepID=A0A371CDK5_YARLL|nr:hypothetical protein B0I71DRAFT_172679 [Yarrowia lipolytica]RDW35860.1 hypothetical protein B0I72DRAFT_149702 [Yarrowia lipolytica]RDW42355.1 hypothetical protein B0I73DRAFT_150976 [Yarrowia lipolytica]RDW49396.1 hypothetical protein B0I74DRAFT_149393 [Yarrowia lipolytica]RDW55602.1 hypothetical protein B0I75DRAFT_171415 [Yarrowia lipolytica]
MEKEQKILEVLKEMARLLDVPLDDEGLRICYEMCKDGSVEPAALAEIFIQYKKQFR